MFVGIIISVYNNLVAIYTLYILFVVDFNCPVQPWWLVGDVVSPCCRHSGWFWTFLLVLVAARLVVDFVSPSCSYSGWCGLC